MLFLLNSKRDVVWSLGATFNHFNLLWFKCYSTVLFYFSLLRFSFFFPKSSLLDLCPYALNIGYRQFCVISYIFKLGFITTCVLLPATGLYSIERLFRNSRWLEREVSENLGLFFSGKRDSRALFLVPILYWAVFKKDFPAEGLTELRLDPWSGKIFSTFIGLVL